MPQLNPTPWLPILVFSWLVFLYILPPKVINHAFPNEPAMQNTQKFETITWTWPWH
uniref:ATP synthase complex subunit 8 n=1 Tax=Pseudotrichonotus altivelis TaxID=172137 RepID=A0A0E4B8E1_9TELE|nr:adenosine triphosphatase subunit 8 [Pseudotrichonotus altivelis]